MSTRANVVIKNDKGEDLWLYKHHDGYVSYTGGELEFAFTFKRDVEASVEYLLENGFEVTEGEHGDIEYLYVIRNLGSNNIMISVYHYKWNGEKKEGKEIFCQSGQYKITWVKFALFVLSEKRVELEHNERYLKKELEELEFLQQDLPIKVIQ
jgi:hypothetical protein|tara:strand:- start:231 stop:689 length:459 start_codon:yes stop_codon:yes gene_type:complete